jgi:DNA-directed RNA polymerase specialized sigma24 family protein
VSRISRNNCQASAETLSPINRRRNVSHHPTQYNRKVLLRAALSSENTAFAKLLRLAKDTKFDGDRPELLQVNTVNVDKYRMHRKLNPAQQAEMIALYEAGASMLDLSKKFETHRHTVARQLAKAGVAIRPQRKMTSELLAQATSLYNNDHSLEEVGRLLGLQASTIGKALKRAGVELRPAVADRWSSREL